MFFRAIFGSYNYDPVKQIFGPFENKDNIIESDHNLTTIAFLTTSASEKTKTSVDETYLLRKNERKNRKTYPTIKVKITNWLQSSKPTLMTLTTKKRQLML